MKLKELMDGQTYGYFKLTKHNKSCSCYNDEARLLDKYKNKDCVVGYYNGPIGSFVIFKGKIKFFAFFGNLFGHTYTGGRIYKINEAYNFIEKHGVILDKKLFEKLGKDIVFQGI